MENDGKRLNINATLRLTGFILAGVGVFLIILAVVLGYTLEGQDATVSFWTLIATGVPHLVAGFILILVVFRHNRRLEHMINTGRKYELTDIKLTVATAVQLGRSCAANITGIYVNEIGETCKVRSHMFPARSNDTGDLVATAYVDPQDPYKYMVDVREKDSTDTVNDYTKRRRA